MIFLSSPAMISWKICVSIIANDTEDAIQKMRMAEPVADILELRLDSMRHFVLEDIIGESKLPLLATYRDPKEGGLKKEVKDEERLRVLKEAIALGIDYVDIELETDEEWRKELFKDSRKTEIIVSKHLFGPVTEEMLNKYADKIFATGADIGKLIGYAETWQDNLMFLELVQRYSKKGHRLVSFAMGPYGRPSRIMSPLFGAAWTYAALKKEEKAAPGQIEASILRKIWEEISCED
ncbi:MAG: hypothetical protein DRG39_05325 [Deltaproteobacteria bacterium]|nr:MAG: hypothetical protein DRG39_05325 [Deltaproteobacteria bacterium]